MFENEDQAVLLGRLNERFEEELRRYADGYLSESEEIFRYGALYNLSKLVETASNENLVLVVELDGDFLKGSEQTRGCLLEHAEKSDFLQVYRCERRKRDGLWFRVDPYHKKVGLSYPSQNYGGRGCVWFNPLRLRSITVERGCAG